MKYLLRFSLVALALFCSGCPSVPRVSAGPALRELGRGLIEHSASGMHFPATGGGFTRVGTRQYDAAGLDVSAGYNSVSPSAPIAVTVYVYPSPPVYSIGSPPAVVADAKRTLARREYQRAMHEILQLRPGARILSEEDVPAPAPAAHPSGFLAHFNYSENFAGQIRPVESLLYVYCHVGDAWTIKYRVTYPAGIDARAAIDRLLQDLPWTVGKSGQEMKPGA